MLNRSYWPDVEATGQLLSELCEDLAASFSVTVVAGQPNANPSEECFHRIGNSKRNGVDIHRVMHTQWSKQSMPGRVVNLLSYLATATIHSLFLPRPAVIVVETDPPLLSWVGYLLKLRFRCPLILCLQDIYPDVAVAVGKLSDGWTARCVRKTMAWFQRRADRVIVLSDDMKRHVRRTGIAADKVHCIANWADTGALNPQQQPNSFRLQHGLADRFVVMYSGNLGLTQRLEHVLMAARQLQGLQDVAFVFVGNGVRRNDLEKQTLQLNLTNVQFLDYQPKECLVDSLSAADVHLVPLAPELAGLLMPSKLYGILAVGRSVIAMADPSCELSRIVNGNRIGLVVEPSNAVALADALRWCASHRDQVNAMGQRARRLSVNQFDRRISTNAYRELITSVVCRS